MNLDKAIVNGTIVTPSGSFSGSIGIKEGKIACITDPLIKLNAEEIIDVKGKFIIPGAIDAHIHYQEPLDPQRENFECATSACAVGGITTGIGMPSQRLLNVENYNLDVAAFEGRGYIDYGLHGLGNPKNIDDIEDLWTKTGVTAIKMFMTYDDSVDDAAIWDILEKLKKHNALSIIHAENESLIKLFEDRLKAKGRKDPMAHVESRPKVVEIEAIRRLAYLVEQTNGKLIVAHVSTVEGLEEIRKAQEKGVKIWAESCPHFFTFIGDDVKEHGTFLATTPVMRDEKNRLKMWELLDKGYIETIGSDHCPTTLSEKEVGSKNIWESTFFGIPGLEVFLPSLLDGVNKNLVSLERIISVTSYNPAKLHGLYPKKGVLRPGSDADIVVIDMELEKTYTERDRKSKCPYSPYFGRTFKGWPVLTMVRGEVVARDGEIVGKKGYGKLVTRDK